MTEPRAGSSPSTTSGTGPHGPEGGLLRNWRIWAALLTVGTLWGSAFPLVRVTAPPLGAVGVTFARIALGALLLALFVTVSGAARRRRTWQAMSSQVPALLLLAAVNAAIPPDPSPPPGSPC